MCNSQRNNDEIAKTIQQPGKYAGYIHISKPRAIEDWKGKDIETNGIKIGEIVKEHADTLVAGVFEKNILDEYKNGYRIAFDIVTRSAVNGDLSIHNRNHI